MAERKEYVQKAPYCMLLLFVLVITLLLNSPANGRFLSYLERENPLHELHHPTAMTIEGDDGEVVDCVYMHLQPSLAHPLLHNHETQMEPLLYPSKSRGKNSVPQLMQPWRRNGECANGTIPIRRQLQTISIRRHLAESKGPHYEHAMVNAVAAPEMKFSGGRARINIWNPTAGDFSSAQLRVVAGQGHHANALQAGWIVYPQKYGDNWTRLFIYWARDQYNKTGCFDHDCPGFVQVNNKYALGGSLSPVSTYGGQQHEINLPIFQDKTTGNWWLLVRGTPIGYWPGLLFTKFGNGADKLMWGGQICDSGVGDGLRHIMADMGSGHHPQEGLKRTNYFGRVQYFDPSNRLRDPEPGTLQVAMTKPQCYNALVSPVVDPQLGAFFYYGGPVVDQFNLLTK